MKRKPCERCGKRPRYYNTRKKENRRYCKICIYEIRKRKRERIRNKRCPYCHKKPVRFLGYYILASKKKRAIQKGLTGKRLTRYYCIRCRKSFCGATRKIYYRKRYKHGVIDEIIRLSATINYSRSKYMKKRHGVRVSKSGVAYLLKKVKDGQQKIQKSARDAS